MANPIDISGLNREELTKLLGEVLARLLVAQANTPASLEALLSPEDLAKRWNVGETWSARRIGAAA
jgi:hypothetical protein